MDLCCMKSQSPVLWEFREAHWSNEMCEVTTLLVQLHHLMTLSSSLVIRALCQTLTPAALQWPLPQRLPRVPTSHCHQTHCPDVHVSGWQLEGEPSMESAVAALWRISCVQVCEGILRKWCRWSPHEIVCLRNTAFTDWISLSQRCFFPFCDVECMNTHLA